MKSIQINPTASLKEVATLKSVDCSSGTATVVYSKMVTDETGTEETTPEDVTLLIDGELAQNLHDTILEAAIAAHAAHTTDAVKATEAAATGNTENVQPATS